MRYPIIELHMSDARSLARIYTANPFSSLLSPLGGERGERDEQRCRVQPSTETNWLELPIIPDPPFASRFTEAYQELKPFWNLEACERVQCGRRPLGFEQLITIDSHGDHQRIVNHLTQTSLFAALAIC